MVSPPRAETVTHTVVVLEDDPAQATVLVASIERSHSLRLAAHLDSVAAAIAWFEHGTADILLADLALPDGSGLDVIRFVRGRHPSCDVVVLTLFGDDENVLASIEAGAVGYLHKDVAMDAVADTLLEVTRGASPISPMVARGLLARLRAAPVVSGSPRLSPSEGQVLELIARGFTNAEIAQLRAVSLNTVLTQIKSLYAKLEVRSRTEAVFEATRAGLLGPAGQGRAR